MSSTMEVHRVSSCYIKPHKITQESQEPYHLTPWDLAMLSVNYIQKGLLYPKPPHLPIETILDQLKSSLSQTLTHFFPLSGRLVTQKSDNPQSYSVSVNCTDSPGAEFIYATSDITLSEIAFRNDISLNLEFLFPFQEIINHDGHAKPLLAVQVTELSDGIFVGVSFSHSVGDGTSFWHFFNVWSQISRQKEGSPISRPPITKRWFRKNHGPIINLPFSHHDEFIYRYIPPPLEERTLNFSSKSIFQLKSKANLECNTTKISSFQALTAFIWRSITRSRQMPITQETSCRLAIDNRSRLRPTLSKDYFGNCIQVVKGTTTAGELLSNNLGWSAWLLHEAVSKHSDKSIRMFLEEWEKAPFIYNYVQVFDRNSMMMGSGPRFDMYGNDFGWGKPLGIRSGFGSKFDGKASAFPGYEEGSVDLEICLPTYSMAALLADTEFIDAISI
ncbi:hypothetical protein ACHQM5_023928 [Ranunculus cassubicifolius]